MTTRYKKILLAVDFHEDNVAIIETAKDLADLYGAELHAVHVREPFNVAYVADGVGWSDQIVALEAGVKKECEKKLTDVKSELGLSDDQCHLLVGRPSTKIHELCKEQNIDLIVMGTHGQHGLELLLGSTANSVLHGVTCDVHAVRLAA